MNLVILKGNIGRDPEIKYTQQGTAVCNISIATTERWVKDGQKHEETTWHRCVSFGKQAETLNQYVKKGDQLLITGRIKNGQYEKDGQTHYTSDIHVKEFEFIGGQQQSQPEQNRQRQGYKPQGGNPPEIITDDAQIPF